MQEYILKEKINFKFFFNWEIILLILTNLAIFFNLFINLNYLLASFIGNFDKTDYGIYNVETHFDITMCLSFLLIPLFIIIKYLSLPISILIVNKFSKNQRLKNQLSSIAKNNKLKILLIAVSLDIIICFIDFTIYKISGNYFYNTYIYWHLIFGGLTGSYLIIFLFSFIIKKLKKLKLDTL